MSPCLIFSFCDSCCSSYFVFSRLDSLDLVLSVCHIVHRPILFHIVLFLFSSRFFLTSGFFSFLISSCLIYSSLFRVACLILLFVVLYLLVLPPLHFDLSCISQFISFTSSCVLFLHSSCQISSCFVLTRLLSFPSVLFDFV